MNTKEIIVAISEKTEIPQYKVRKVIDALKEVVIETTERDEEVHYRNFFIFKAKQVAERRGTHLGGTNAGKSWVKPAHKEIVAKLSLNLKERFLNKDDE